MSRRDKTTAFPNFIFLCELQFWQPFKLEYPKLIQHQTDVPTTVRKQETIKMPNHPR